MRNTNLWSIIGCISLLLLSFGAQAQNLFVIVGKVKNVKQGVCLNLFQMEGSVGSSIAVDTLRGDSFRFEVPVSGTGTTLLSLLIRDGNLYSMGLSLWAKAGSHIRLTGEDMNIYTWQVESDVPQQKIWQLFVKDSRPLLNLLQMNSWEQKKLMRAYKREESKEEKAKMMAMLDSLERIENRLEVRIDSNVIERMKQLPVEEVWMMKLMSLALGVKYTKDYPYRKEVEELYGRLTDEQRQTSQALDIQSYLSSVQTVSVKAKAADGDLYDLQGNIHRLSDSKGKPVLIDFWSRGCGPCLMALPEMKEISRLYEGRLVLVSLSIDDKTNWEIASRHHDICWWNLNDLKGNHGLYAKYSSGAIPRYVFLSSEGEVVEMWSGYSKGSLLKKLGKLME